MGKMSNRHLAVIGALLPWFTFLIIACLWSFGAGMQPSWRRAFRWSLLASLLMGGSVAMFCGRRLDAGDVSRGVLTGVGFLELLAFALLQTLWLVRSG